MNFQLSGCELCLATCSPLHEVAYMVRLNPGNSRAWGIRNVPRWGYTFTVNMVVHSLHHWHEFCRIGVVCMNVIHVVTDCHSIHTARSDETRQFFGINLANNYTGVVYGPLARRKFPPKPWNFSSPRLAYFLPHIPLVPHFSEGVMQYLLHTFEACWKTCKAACYMQKLHATIVHETTA